MLVSITPLGCINVNVLNGALHGKNSGFKCEATLAFGNNAYPARSAANTNAQNALHNRRDAQGLISIDFIYCSFSLARALRGILNAASVVRSAGKFQVWLLSVGKY